MAAKDQQFLRKLLATFRLEAEEHINAMSSGLVELENARLPEKRMEIIETVFREAHSLKGAARAVNLAKVETICQSLESAFSAVKAQEVSLSPELFDRLHQMVSAAGVETAAVSKSQLEEFAEAPGLSARAAISQSSVAGPEPTAEQPVEDIAALRSVAEDGPGLPDTVRVSPLKLDSILRQAEELISTKAVGADRLAMLGQVNAVVALWEKRWRKVRPQVHALRPSMGRQSSANGHTSLSERQKNTLSPIARILTFLEWNEGTLRSISAQLAALAKHLENDRRALDRKVGDLLNDVKSVSMVPFSSLLGIFPKLVRDLCRDFGKEAELVIEGGDVEADRRILEEMKDPLIHLVRNSIDHGIEQPDERERRQKPPRATITIAISPKSSSKVEIVVADDGGGIDLRKVRTAAVKLGLVSKDGAQKMDDREALPLVFRSGISTSPMITEVSGRGLGLAIVREKAEKVGGEVSVEAQLGIGATFRLLLPLTLATFRGILVRVGENLYVLPTMYVQRALRTAWHEIKTVENRETIQLDGRVVSLVRLRDVLGLAETGPTPERKRTQPVLILACAGVQLGFMVDEILGDQEVLVKGLGKQLLRVRNIAGATILGTGNVVPVLNVMDLMRSAIIAAPAKSAREAEQKPQRVLVAEDSITARTLLKTILESAGYRVKTAVDGAEAFTLLCGEEFDLVVSDVDMPRMSGFDLTAKMRADRRLAELPVVLVTALESREDRERGVDAGANAYIVKSSFDQSNLLEVVQRLI